MQKKRISPTNVAVMLLLLLALFTSCSNETEVAIDSVPVKVVTMGQFMSQTRGLQDVSKEMPVLQFKDAASYQSVLNKLRHFSEEERMAYMKQLGFKSAEQTLNDADKELDAIFDIDDETAFKNALLNFKLRYQGIVAFDSLDSLDVTPHYVFTDTTKNVVSNALGYVVIGNKLVGPQEDAPDFSDTYTSVMNVKTRAVDMGPIEPGFRSFGGTSLSIKNGKYKSTMTLGKIVNGDSFAIEFVTKKKQFLWKKKVKASYSLNLEMVSSTFHHSNIVTCPKNCVCILNLPLEAVGNKFDAFVTDFKSSRGTAVGSTTFKNIQVR